MKKRQLSNAKQTIKAVFYIDNGKLWPVIKAIIPDDIALEIIGVNNDAANVSRMGINIGCDADVLETFTLADLCGEAADDKKIK